MEIASAKIENENVYINELYLINGFDERLWPGVPEVSVRIRQSGQVWLEGSLHFKWYQSLGLGVS